MGSSLGSLVCVAVAAVFGDAPLQSPQSRAEALEAARAARAAALVPYAPTTPEAILFAIEDRYLFERMLNAPRGLFARLGGLPTGSGLAGGPAGRYSTHTVSATITSAASLQRAWEIAAALEFPTLADDHVFIALHGRKRELPLEDFSGLGPDAEDSDRTSYRYRDLLVDVTAGVSPIDSLTVAGSFGRLQPAVGPRGGPAGGRAGVPSIETRFDDDSAPGLDQQPAFDRFGLAVRVDATDESLGSRTGSRLDVAWRRYVDRDLDTYSFDHWILDGRQYVPILTGARTLAVRARFEHLAPAAGATVPFYLRPTLGGPDSIRGLRSYRFRDRTLALLQAEYRWPVNAFLGGVFFYDAGTVADGPSRLTLRSFTHDFGLGLRMGFLSQSFLRAEVAFGGTDGTALVLRFGDVF
ncbi:MAG TPA: BamA/TamA family outer membrane protein [Vicinamibacterales bacterium]|nr:BamA/TamA family outer membrane protein [Vicinamibacterales bacterium]